MSDPLRAEMVIDQAAAVALFFRRLVDEGVPMQAAIQMSCSFIGSQLIIDSFEEEPTEPWEDGEP